MKTLDKIKSIEIKEDNYIIVDDRTDVWYEEIHRCIYNIEAFDIDMENVVMNVDDQTNNNNNENNISNVDHDSANYSIYEM